MSEARRPRKTGRLVVLCATVLLWSGCGVAPPDETEPAAVATSREALLTCQQQANLVGDFDGNGKGDILLQHPDGTVAVWLMNGTEIVAADYLGNPGPEWRVGVIADFGGDGRSDILLRRSAGQVAIWEMNGLTIGEGTLLGSVDLAWSVSGAGDFDGNGRADVLLRHTDGSMVLWLMDGATIVHDPALPNLDPSWIVGAVADVNGDGKADLALQNLDSTRAIWTMDGSTVASMKTLPAADSKLFISGAGDFDGDGRDDLLLRAHAQLSSPDSTVWYLNGGILNSTRTFSSQTDYVHVTSLAGVADFDGNGTADILVRTPEGHSRVGLSNTPTAPYMSWQFLPSVQPDWYEQACEQPYRCGNDEKDGDETDIDCGGSCVPCGYGRACLTDDDCSGGFCDGGGCAPRFVSVSVGASHSCAVTDKNALLCWGSVPLDLGSGSSSGFGYWNWARTGVTTGVAEVSVGASHDCLLTTGGQVKCWGWNNEWQLGLGHNISVYQPMSVLNLPATAVEVAAGYDHTCALMADGTPRCWGQSTNGFIKTPTAPPDSIDDNWEIDCGQNFSCALVSTGNSSARCWGYGALLGNGTALPSSIPRDVVGVQNATSISTGSRHACVADGGAAKCWGENDQGQVGDGTTLSAMVPKQVAGLTSGVSAVSAAGSASCAITGSGVACWGAAPVASGAAAGPTLKAGLPATVSQISVGTSHACALGNDGSIWCWGDGSSGKLGTGTTISSDTPVKVRAQ